MKVLVITQTIDNKDPMLGFFHYWLESFSHHFEYIHAVCLAEGEHGLPQNVTVHSLGKNEGKGRMTYIRRLFSYSWKLRDEYDVVFVHMNQEYPILVGWLWKLMGKKVAMWRNHFAGSLLTNLAVHLCNKVFCTSKYSYTAKYKKTVLMPVGVPEEMFKENKDSQRQLNSILSLARLSPSKKIEQLIEALSILKERRVEFTATICGTVTEQHKSYIDKLHEKVKVLGLQKDVVFTDGVSYKEVPQKFWKHEVSVNQSPSGMYDKTIFEGMMCGNLVLSCNKNLRGEIDERFLFQEDNAKEIADKLQSIFMLSEEEKEEHRSRMVQYAKKHHSLAYLSERLKTELENIK